MTGAAVTRGKTGRTPETILTLFANRNRNECPRAHLWSTIRTMAVEPGWPFGGRPKPERLWSLWNTGSLMECEVNAHPRGSEDYRCDLQHLHVGPRASRKP